MTSTPATIVQIKLEYVQAVRLIFQYRDRTSERLFAGAKRRLRNQLVKAGMPRAEADDTARKFEHQVRRAMWESMPRHQKL